MTCFHPCGGEGLAHHTAQPFWVPDLVPSGTRLLYKERRKPALRQGPQHSPQLKGLCGVTCDAGYGTWLPQESCDWKKASTWCWWQAQRTKIQLSAPQIGVPSTQRFNCYFSSNSGLKLSNLSHFTAKAIE